MKTIPYSHQSIDAEDIRLVARILRSDFLTQGSFVEHFEEQLCRYTGARYAVCVANGTAALHLACLAAGLGKGDEVIVPANTFVASANSVLYTGARPVFADIELSTGNVTMDSIQHTATSRTRVVMGVDYAGQPCAWSKISGWAKKRGILLIDDASHALGAEYKVGSSWFKIGNSRHADMTTLSFHPLKTITSGEGGAILTSRRDLYEKLLRLRSHGIVKDSKDFIKLKGRLAKEKYFSQMIDLGFNYRLTDIQCALGVSQLARIGEFVRKRAKIDAAYRKAFAGDLFFDLLELKEGRSAHHLFPILLRDHSRRRVIFNSFRAKGIGVQVHYIPVYWNPYYQALGYQKVCAPQAEEFYRREISLPIYPAMTRADVRRVIKTVFDVMRKT